MAYLRSKVRNLVSSISSLLQLTELYSKGVTRKPSMLFVRTVQGATYATDVDKGDFGTELEETKKGNGGKVEPGKITLIKSEVQDKNEAKTNRSNVVSCIQESLGITNSSATNFSQVEKNIKKMGKRKTVRISKKEDKSDLGGTLLISSSLGEYLPSLDEKLKERPALSEEEVMNKILEIESVAGDLDFGYTTTNKSAIDNKFDKTGTDDVNEKCLADTKKLDDIPAAADDIGLWVGEGLGDAGD